MSGAQATTREITTATPARRNRLPWSRFHLLVVVALGITWVLDGLEVTIVGSIGPILKDKQTLALTDQDIGSVAASSVAGAVVGCPLLCGRRGRGGPAVRLVARPVRPSPHFQRDPRNLSAGRVVQRLCLELL